MNILVIGNSESVHTVRFAAGFAERGHKIHVLSTREYFGDYVKYPEEVKHVRFLRWVTKFFQFIFGKKLRNFNPGTSLFYHPSNFLILLRHIYLVLFVNRVVKDVDFDAIFALNLSVGGLLASRITRKVPKVCATLGCDVRTYRFPEPAYFVNHPSIIRYVLKRLNAVITGDKEAFEPVFEKKGFIELSKFEYFGHFGIEIARFSPEFKDPRLRRELFDVDEDNILAICHRPPRPDLDFENILISVDKVISKHANFVFVIISGAANTEYLKEIVRELKIEDNIRFIGNVPYEKLNLYIAQGDIFIDPVNLKKTPTFAHQGVSGSILEAMSCGLIPVVSNRPSISWILPPEARPFIFEDFETDLTDALERAINEKDNQGIRDAMRNAVVEKANWDKNFDYIEKLLLPANRRLETKG